MKPRKPNLTRWTRHRIAGFALAACIAGFEALSAHSRDLDPQLISQWSPGFGAVARAVAVEGGFAYVALSSSWDPATRTDVIGGLRVIDFTDPANPRMVGSYDSNNPIDVAVSGDHVFLVIASSLQVIDARDPSNPQRMGSYPFAGSPNDIAISGNYAFVAENVGKKGQIEVVDISDPANPRQVGIAEIEQEARAIAIAGQHAFVAVSEIKYSAGLEDSWTAVFDISDPAKPRAVGRLDALANAFDVVVSGNYAYVADGGGYNADQPSEGLSILDISDPTTPRRVSTLRGEPYTIRSGHHVAVSGDVAMLSTDRWGVLIIDVSNPANRLSQ